MARRGMSQDRQRELAVQAAQRLIARGERPGYRMRPTEDGRWTVLEAPWLSVAKPSGGRAAIAAWLDCEPNAFDLET